MTLRELQRRSGRALGLSPAQIQGRRRSLAQPRQVVMAVCRHYSTESLPRIGASIGERDHATIFHGLRAVDARCAADPAYARLVSLVCYLVESEITDQRIRALNGAPKPQRRPPVALLPAPWHRLAGRKPYVRVRRGV